KRGKGIVFDGGNDKVRVAYADSLNTSRTGLLTVSAWIYLTGSGSSHAIVSHEDSSGPNFYYYVGGSTASKLGAFLVNITGTGSGWKESTTTINPNRWYHTAFTYSGSQIQLYIDGQLDSTYAFYGGLSPTSSPIDIGTRNNGLHYFKGTIDEDQSFKRRRNQLKLQHRPVQAKQQLHQPTGRQLLDTGTRSGRSRKPEEHFSTELHA
ncbi:LamG domain-containing protein, partial [Candidatus Woesearchaeota archaeon]|nr:LamG domain-containing protein [Candidatus Woesearchaeota archaeon]